MMPSRIVSAAIVGAGSLLGKELAEELNEASSLEWRLTLLDAGDTSSQLTAAGDEPALIQPLERDSFEGMEIVFFAGDAETTLKHWRAAVAAGAAVVDLTGALDGEAGVPVYSSWIKAHGQTSVPPALDLATAAVVSAHPAAVMLGLVMARLGGAFPLVRVSATVLEPASQQGSAGLDEMHAQTVSLLSFQTLPTDVFGTQVAFNFNAVLGAAARTDLAAIAQIIRLHVRSLVGSEMAGRCALQLIQAPVFSGYAASVFLEIDGPADVVALERALEGGVVSVPGPEDVAPSNQSATEEGKLLVRLTSEPFDPEANGSERGSRFWLWMTADNLRLAARNAVGCASELLAMRPGGKPQ